MICGVSIKLLLEAHFLMGTYGPEELSLGWRLAQARQSKGYKSSPGEEYGFVTDKMISH